MTQCPEELLHVSPDPIQFYSAFQLPEQKWELHITDGFLVCHERRPNWWFRLMQRILLGWKWTQAG